jgi:serine/threonine protein kinase
MVLRLLDVIEYCHSKNVLHRDCKPDNIVLQNDQSDLPVLIDFGLSFNEEPKAELPETDSQQHMGNRFLRLPEHQMRGDKRDRRSDLAQIVGILFFAITGEYPDTLFDGLGLKPHHRERARSTLDKIPTAEREPLIRIFEVGFNIEFLRRWQSAEQLRDAFGLLVAAGATEPKVAFTDRMASLRDAALSTPENVIRVHVEKLLGGARTCMHQLILLANREFHSVGAFHAQQFFFQRPNTMPLAHVVFVPRFSPNKSLAFSVHTVVVDGLMRLELECEQRVDELATVGIFDPLAATLLQTGLERAFGHGNLLR